MVQISKNSPGTILFYPDILPVRFAAEQLAYYLALLTGAHPQAVPADASSTLGVREGNKRCVPGTSSVHDRPRYWLVWRQERGGGAQGTPPVPQGDGQGEKWELSVARGQATLTATTPFALVHGVYRILERFGGVRWINRLEGDEFIPRIGTFAVRDGYYWGAARFAARAFTNYPYIGPTTADFLDWMAKNGFNQFMINAAVPDSWQIASQYLFDIALARGIELTLGHHTFSFWISPDEFFNNHPEFFALIDGQRRPDGQLCTSNPDVRRLVAERIVEFLRNNPGVREVALWPNDGYGWCQCGTCLEQEPQQPSWWSADHPKRTDTYLKFVNAVAERVADEVPGVRITALAYVNYAEPPANVRPADNVAVYFAPFRRCFKHPLGAAECAWRNKEYGEMLKRWTEIAPDRVRLFSYLMQVDTLSLPYRLTNVIPLDMALLSQLGIDGWVMEYDEREWATFGANAYLLGRLAWDGDGGVPERGEQWLREVLYPALYGAAAEHLAEYFDELTRLVVDEGPCTGHYDLTWTMRATPGYLKGALEALGRGRAVASPERAAWRSVERVCVAAELLIRVGHWQRRMADLAGAGDFTRPRRLELAQQAARRVAEWAEKWAASGAVNAEKVVARVRKEMERVGGR